MYIREFRHLYKLVRAIALTSVSLVTLNSCESTKYLEGYELNPLIAYKNDLLCPALSLDESVYNIKSNGSQYSLTNRDTDKFEIEIELNTKEETLNIVDLKILGKPVDLKTFNGTLLSRYSEVEAKYCSRFFNKDIKSFFSSDVGIPASALDYAKPRLEYSNNELFHFSEPVKTGLGHVSRQNIEKRSFTDGIGLFDEEDVRNRVDWEIILDLNIRAHEIWNEYLKKYSHEEIRSMYFNGEIQAFKELKEEIELILESSEFLTTYNQRHISHYHPAFSQMILEIMLENYILGKKQVDSEYVKTEEGIETVVDKSLIDYIIKNNVIGKRFVDYYSTFSKKKTTVVANTIVLIQTFSHLKCEEWGLRPELTRLYLPYRLKNNLRPLEMNSYSGDNIQVYFPTITNHFSTHIVNSISSACGDAQDIKLSLGLDGSFLSNDLIYPFYLKNFNLAVDEVEKRFFRK